MYLDIMRIKHELPCLRRAGLFRVQKYHILCNHFELVRVEYYLIKAKSQFRVHEIPAVHIQVESSLDKTFCAHIFYDQSENENIIKT